MLHLAQKYHSCPYLFDMGLPKTSDTAQNRFFWRLLLHALLVVLADIG